MILFTRLPTWRKASLRWLELHRVSVEWVVMLVRVSGLLFYSNNAVDIRNKLEFTTYSVQSFASLATTRSSSFYHNYAIY
jgi:hypothetical protein